MSRRCLAANALALLAVPNRDAFAAGLRPALGPGRFRATRFEGEYSDLLHPLCDRKIAVDTSALKQSGGGDYFLATFSGNDIGPPGALPLAVLSVARCPRYVLNIGVGNVVRASCDAESVSRYGLRDWSFEARISRDGEQARKRANSEGSTRDLYHRVNAACRRWMPATACMWAGGTRGLLMARLGKASDGKTATAGSWSNKRQNDARGRGLLECVRAVVASYSRAALLSADHICGGTYHKSCMPAQRWFCREGMPMRVD